MRLEIFRERPETGQPDRNEMRRLSRVAAGDINGWDRIFYSEPRFEVLRKTHKDSLESFQIAALELMNKTTDRDIMDDAATKIEQSKGMRG